MKEVKILLCQEIGGDDYYGETVIRDSISDWEEISEEDLTFLRKNLHSMNLGKEMGYNFQARLIIKDEIPVSVRIANIKSAINAQLEKQQERKKQLEKKKKEKELKKLEKDKEKQKELFLKLKEEFEP